MNAKLRLVINEKLPISEESGVMLYKANEGANHISSKDSTPKEICMWVSSLQSCSMASTLARR